MPGDVPNPAPAKTTKSGSEGRRTTPYRSLNGGRPFSIPYAVGDDRLGALGSSDGSATAGTMASLMIMITVFMMVMKTRSLQETTQRAASMTLIVLGTTHTQSLPFNPSIFFLSNSIPPPFKHSEISQY